MKARENTYLRDPLFKGAILAATPGGMSIDDVVKEMQAAADHEGCPVLTEFNGVFCAALPGGTSKMLLRAYYRHMERQGGKPAGPMPCEVKFWARSREPEMEVG